MKERFCLVISILSLTSLIWGFWIAIIMEEVDWIPKYLFGRGNIIGYLPLWLVTAFDIFASIFCLINSNKSVVRIISVVGGSLYFILSYALFYLGSIA